MNRLLFYFPLLAAALLPAGCAQIGSRIERLPPDAAARGYVLLPRPVLLPKSRLTADCGPESICAVMNYWGRPAPVEEISRLLQSPGGKGMFSSDVPLLARRNGLQAVFLDGSVERVKKAILRGVPLILMVDTGGDRRHFFIVTGHNDAERTVVCEEYGGAKRLIPYDELEARWEAAGHMMLELEVSTADSDCRAGMELEAGGLYDKAEVLYRRALQAQPDHGEARIGLANCLRHLGKAEEAVAEYRKALDSDPDDPKAANNLADLYLELRREPAEAERLADRAVERLESALRHAKEACERERRPELQADLRRAEFDLALGLGTLGQARAANKKDPMAVAAWKASFDILPLTEFDLRARRLLEIALACRRLSMPAEARANFDRALREARDPALRARIEAEANPPAK